MNKYFKGAIIFGTGVIGGFGACGGFVIKKILMTDDLREFLIKKASKKILNSIYGKSNYYNYYRDTDTKTGAFIFESRGEAEEVLSRMNELIDTYGLVSVADAYDLCGTTSVYTDNKRGWTNLDGAEVIRIRGGYYKLCLPKALPIW